MSFDPGKARKIINEIADEAHGNGNSYQEGAWLPESLKLLDNELKEIYEAGQRDMRERAVSVSLDAFNHALNGDEIADEIRAIKLESEL